MNNYVIKFCKYGSLNQLFDECLSEVFLFLSAIYWQVLAIMGNVLIHLLLVQLVT